MTLFFINFLRLTPCAHARHYKRILNIPCLIAILLAASSLWAYFLHNTSAMTWLGVSSVLGAFFIGGMALAATCVIPFKTECYISLAGVWSNLGTVHRRLMLVNIATFFLGLVSLAFSGFTLHPLVSLFLSFVSAYLGWRYFHFFLTSYLERNLSV